MDDKIKDAFSALEAPEQMKRTAKARINRAIPRIRRRRRNLAALTAAAAACFLVWFHPVTCIGLDINPSLEIRVNTLDRVIGVEGLNADGEALASAMDVKGRPYEDAMNRILLSDQLGSCLEEGSLLSITVTGAREDHTARVLNRVVCRAYAVAEDDQVFYILADAETTRAARKAGMSVARYQAWQAARSADPTVTAEAVQAMTMAEIRELLAFEKLDDPCNQP